MYSMNIIYQIWDDEFGSRVEVKPDGGDGLVTVSYFDEEDKLVDAMEFPPEQALLIADAMKALAQTLINEQKEREKGC